MADFGKPFGRPANTYDSSTDRRGQQGQQYPNLQSSNPLQDVRDTYRQPQEIAYKMQPGRFMPAVNPNVQINGQSDSRATIRSGGYQPGDQNFDLRAKSFDSLDQNMRMQWVDTGPIDATDGRK